MTTTEVLQFGEAYLKGQFHETFYVSFCVMKQLPDNRFVASDDDTGEIRCTGSSLSHPDLHGSYYRSKCLFIFFLNYTRYLHRGKIVRGSKLILFTWRKNCAWVQIDFGRLGLDPGGEKMT
jgi:hypothetical protein